jgi:hypothetical protein
VAYEDLTWGWVCGIIGFMNKQLNSFENYLLRRLNFYNSAIALIEHSSHDAEKDTRDYQLLRSELNDIIQHFIEIVKKEKERKAEDE